MTHPDGVEVLGPAEPRFDEILTDEALAFVAGLQREFGGRRAELLEARAERQARLDEGERPDFLEATRSVREADWRVAPAPPDLHDRRVEITGPADRKMMINALNCGARCFMADLEDANAPTWANMVEGQVNLADAVRGTLELTGPDGREYRLADETATLLVRPRGWHLPERHVLVDGAPMSASLFDFGLAFFHNAREQLERGTGPYFYLPKLESHLEARLWNDVFVWSQERLGIPRGTIRATVLIETILAAFEMDEILYELREHSAGLNAGRWDYIFSVIKKFRAPPRVRPARPRPGHDDRAVHARLHGAAGADLPPARRPRDGRDGRVHPQPAGPRGQRARAGQGARGQGARVERRVRRDVGGPPGPRRRSRCRVRPRPGRPAEPDRPAARGRGRHRGGAARRARPERRDHRGGPGGRT